jgi:hypothetical protein
MSYARQMIDAYPRTSVDPGTVAAAIDAINDCAQACTADVDADLSERNLTELLTCIRLCFDCADVCTAAAGVVSRQSAHDPDMMRALLGACISVCKSCGDECERHAQMHDHCRVCAEACRKSEQACRELLGAMN